MEEQTEKTVNVLQTVLNHFKCQFYVAYFRKGRKKNFLKKQAEHLRYVLCKEVEDPFRVMKAYEKRRLQKSCIKWVNYLERYGFPHEKTTRKFISFVNQIMDLDVRYQFGKDDENYIDYKYISMDRVAQSTTSVKITATPHFLWIYTPIG